MIDVFQTYQQADKLKTIAEHERIILNYRQTGWLDRDYALSVYCDFSRKNPDYRAYVRMETSLKGGGADVTTLSNEMIVVNLNEQLKYLTGKSLLEELHRSK